jgi:hypothetical protein
MLGLVVSICGAGAARAADPPVLADVTAARGVEFRHRFFPTGEKYMPENMGPGVAIFDYDGDGALDLYFVQSAPVLAVGPAPPEAANRLYRQTEDGRFEDVTERAGVGDRGVGQGVAIGDYDDDGAPDIYVTNYGANVLFHNRGDGTFEDVTAVAGVAGDSWSTGAAFVDIDRDGDLDIHAAAYLTYDPRDNRYCGNAQTGLRAYCHPDVYGGQTDSLYLNEGGGRFRDASVDMGLVPGDDSRGLGVAVADFDLDGELDLYVGNDTTANHLYILGSDGVLQEDALFVGVAVNGSGQGEASMGMSTGDLDGDGWQELLVTHLDEETNTLYRALGPGVYADATETAGLATPSRPWVAFGIVPIDIGLDGDLDLLIANGHIIDNIAAFDSTLSHRQPFQLLRNDGSGRFSEEREGLGVSELIVGRGLAKADLDRDGDVDVVMVQNGDAAKILDNVAPPAGRALTFLVRQPDSASWGTRWELTEGERRQARWFERAPSYCSQSAPEVVLAASGLRVDVVERPRHGVARRYRSWYRAGATSFQARGRARKKGPRRGPRDC